MQQSKPPKAISVEVATVKPTNADSAIIKQLNASQNKSLPEVAYVVQIRLESIPPAVSHGWALYVNDLRIPKYWEYKEGIYFKVFDPQFFEDHKGQPLRFSENETDFIDTGLELEAPRCDSPVRELTTQDLVNPSYEAHNHA